MATTSAAAIILAAGASTRMGRPKVALPYRDGTMLNCVVAASVSAGLDPIVVVTGYHADAVLPSVPEPAVAVENRHPEDGAGSSLRVGLEAIPAEKDVVVLLADAPDVDPATIAHLVSTARHEGSVAGWVRYSDGEAHPIFLSVEGRERFSRTEGDRPLWSLLSGLGQGERTDLDVEDAKPRDLNSPEDYRLATSIGFDDFMRSSLYDPEHGFFSAGPVRAGRDGDFVTSPEVSPWFGRLIGRWARSEVPPGTHLIEVGAGTGSLLEPLLDEVGDHFATTTAVEISPAARSQVRERLPKVAVTADLDLPTSGSVLVIANELLDNLPAKIVERTDDGWVEWRVTTIGRPEFVAVAADTGLAEWCPTFLPDAPSGARLAAQTEVAAWIAKLASRPDTRVLALDYSATTGDLAKRSPDRIVRTFRRHQEGADPLRDPGATDLTLEVNVDVVTRAAQSVGASVDVTSQATFLSDCGADEAMRELRSREHERAAAGDVMAQLSARSEAVDLGALLDARGLGGFTVIDVQSGTIPVDDAVET